METGEGGMLKSAFEAIAGEFRGEPSDLIPALQRIQAVEGYLSAESLRLISRWLKISENEIYGVATFFSQFRFARPGRHVLKVCLGTACHVRGGEQILDVIKRRFHIEPGEVTADGQVQLERVACLGCCALAPVAAIDDKIYGQTSVLKIQEILDERERGDRS
jgi:NADH-quinone oxidoreductase subunit E